ncbi:YggT family protein [Humidesulfovibrio idahonensis]
MSYLMIIVTTLVSVIGWMLSAYMWVVIISALITWVNPDPYNPIVRFLRNATEPVFYRIRRWLPFVVVGGFDLSPILVIVGIQIITRILNQLVWDFASARMMGALSSVLVG